MLQKIIYVIFILSTLTFYSYGIHISEYNETKLLLSINSQLSELRAGQEKLTKELPKELDIQILRTDTQFIRTEIERQKNCVVVKEADSESSRADIQSLRAKLEKLKNEKEADIQSLRADIQVFRTDIQSLRDELEHQKKDILEKEAAIQSLRADNQGFRIEIQSLRAELEQQKKLDKEADNQSLSADLEKQNTAVPQTLGGEVEQLEKFVDGLVKEKNKFNGFLNTHNCTEAKFSGIYNIVVPKFSSQPFKAACDAETREGGWTIVLRRLDGSVNFNRSWTEYKNGFGNLDGEYFLGLDKIHAMTAERRQELLVILEDFEGDERFETYDEFAIGNEDEQYKLHTLGKANGTAGDSLDYHRGWKFTTFDRDNDWNDENCAIIHSGGWWFGSCSLSHLTGTYKDNRYMNGVTWLHFRGSEYSLKRAVMMIRPKER